MKTKLRAWIEYCGNGKYRLCDNVGGHTDPTSDREGLIGQMNHINNEDGDSYYFDDGRPEYDEELEKREKREEERREYLRRVKAERAERLSKQRKINEKKLKDKEKNNRKSKETDEKYVFVISMIKRNSGSRTRYFRGETNILKFTSFSSLEIKDAKVYLTKSSAQKIVDKLRENALVDELYRKISVVRKDKKLFNI